jgi:hypothetical protein
MGTQAGILTRSLALLVISLPVAAGEPVAAGVRACLGETDATRRLACYDREVGKTVSAQSTELFGADGALLQKLVADGTGSRQSKEITARISSLTHRPDELIVLRLDNDQVWEQSESGPDLKLGVGDPVRITRGALGSYWLSATSALAIKIRRTK